MESIQIFVWVCFVTLVILHKNILITKIILKCLLNTLKNNLSLFYVSTYPQLQNKEIKDQKKNLLDCWYT